MGYAIHQAGSYGSPDGILSKSGEHAAHGLPQARAAGLDLVLGELYLPNTVVREPPKALSCASLTFRLVGEIAIDTSRIRVHLPAHQNGFMLSFLFLVGHWVWLGR